MMYAYIRISLRTWSGLTPRPQAAIIRGVMSPSLLPRPVALPPWWSGRLLLFALALLALATLGRLPLVDEDEGEYSEVAAELAHSSEWLAPTLNGQPFYEKPALLFWLQAPLVRLLGPDELAFRLPSLACTVAWAALLLSWWSRQRGQRPATIATWLAVTSAGVVVVGRAATMDALVLLLTSLTLFDLWDWLDHDQRAPLRRAALWAGLGMLAKGPVALVIPAVVLAALLATTPPLRARWRALLDPWAWLILLAVALPWYLWYGLHSGGEFLRYFFLRENAGRLGGSLQGHGGSVLYYLPVLPVLLLPHGGVLVVLFRQWRRIWSESLERFLLLWFLSVFLLFSLAGTKLPHYLLYACTPLFLLGGRGLAENRGDDRLRSLFELVGTLLLPLLALLLPLLAARLARTSGDPYQREMFALGATVFGPAYWGLASGWLFAALACLLLSWRQRAPAPPPEGALGDGRVVRLPGRSVADPRWLVIGPGLVSTLGISLVLLPTVTAFQQEPVRAAARFAAGLGVPVVADDRMPSFAVYLGRPTLVREVAAGDVAFGRINNPDRLGRQHQVLFARGGVRVVRVEQP